MTTFVSYAREDLPLARRLVDALEERGWDVWVDLKGIPPSAPWRAEISSAIIKADAFVAVVSPSFLASEVCAWELEQAVASSKRLVPVVVERLISSKEVPADLRELNWLHLDGTAAFAEGMERLDEVLRTDLTRARLHAGLLVQARRWEEQGGEKSLLLRGAELVEAENWLADQTGTIPAPLPDHAQFINASRRTASRLSRMQTGIAVAVSVVLAIATVFAFTQRNTAREQALSATARQLVSDAESLRDTQPDLARQLLVQAHRLAVNDSVTNDLVAAALIRSPAIPRVISARSLAWGLAFTPDGRRLLVASNAGVALHDTATDALLGTLDKDSGPTRSLSVSPDGQLLATGGVDGSVRIFDLTARAGPTVVARLPAASSSAVDTVRFAGGSSRLVVGQSNGTAWLWDLSDRQAPRVLSAVPGDSTLFWSALAVNPGGTLLAVTKAGNRIALYDISRSGDPRQTALLEGHSGQVTALAFSADGSLLASAARDDTVRLWSIGGGAMPVLLSLQSGPSSGVDSIGFSPDSTTLAAGSGDHATRLWNISDPTRPRQGAVLTGQSDSIRALAFSPDSRTLATAGADGTRATETDYANSTIRLWPTSAGRRPESITRLVPGGRATPTFTADGQVVAVGYPTTLWSLTDPSRPGLLSRVPAAYDGGGRAAAFDASGRVLISGDPLVVWNADDPAHLVTARSGGPIVSSTVAAAVSPSGNVAMTGASSRPYQLWTMDGGGQSPASTIEDSVAAPQAAAFAPKGDLFAVVGKNQTVGLWNIEDPARPRLVSALSGADPATTVAFATIGALLAVGASNGTVTLWNIEDAARPVQLAAVARHTGAVDGVAIHGSLMASTGEDGTVRLTSIAEPERPVELARLDDGGDIGAAQIAFNPQGTTLMAAGSNFAAVWDTDVGRLLGHLCGDSAPLSPADWVRYLPDLPYEPPCR